jgi:hypothetical protein
MLANVALALLAAPLALGRPQDSNEHRRVGRIRRQPGAGPHSHSCHVRTTTYLSNSAPTGGSYDGHGSGPGDYEPGLPGASYEPGLPTGSYEPGLPTDGYEPGLPTDGYEPGLPTDGYEPGLPTGSYEPSDPGYPWGTDGNGGISNTLPGYPHISYSSSSNNGGGVGPIIVTTTVAESTSTSVLTTTFTTYLPTTITTGGSTITTSILATLTETVTTTATTTDSFTFSVTESVSVPVTESISVTDIVPTTITSLSTLTDIETVTSISDGLTITATQITTFISTQLITSISGIILPTNSINFLILSIQPVVTEAAVPVVRRYRKRQDDTTISDDVTFTDDISFTALLEPTDEFTIVGAAPTDELTVIAPVPTDLIAPVPTGGVTPTDFDQNGFIGVGAGSDPNPQDCTDAARFLQLNTQLFFNDDYPIGVEPDVPFIDLSIQAPGSISTSFSIENGVLVWANALFSNGLASFCQTPNGSVFAIFDALLTPADCELKDLVVYPGKSRGHIKEAIV